MRDRKEALMFVALVLCTVLQGVLTVWMWVSV